MTVKTGSNSSRGRQTKNIFFPFLSVSPFLQIGGSIAKKKEKKKTTFQKDAVRDQQLLCGLQAGRGAHGGGDTGEGQEPRVSFPYK